MGERGWTSTKTQLVGRARLGMTLGPLLGSTVLNWVDVSKKQLVALDGLVDVADEGEGREEPHLHQGSGFRFWGLGFRV